MKCFLKVRAALLPCAAAMLLATIAHADTLTGTTDAAAFTGGEGVSWFTQLELQYPGLAIDLGGIVSADATGVLQGLGIDEPLTPYSMTVTEPHDFDFFASLTDVDAELYQAGSYDPVTFSFAAGSVNGFGINLYGYSPLESATLTAYNAANVQIGSVTVDSPTQFVGILDNNVNIASLTLTTGNGNAYAFGTAYFTTPEPGTILLISLPLAVFLFNRVRRSNTNREGSG